MAELSNAGDKLGAARIAVLLEELDADDAAKQELLDDGRDLSQGVSVCLLAKFQYRHRLNLWRLRALEGTENSHWSNHRLIYGVDHGGKRFWFLAVMPRSEEYDDNNYRFRRVRQEYEQLGLPILPRG